MNLGKQIHSICKTNVDVYVKGLGVFRRMHTPASFDKERNVFLPPTSSIAFSIHGRQGLDLISYYQQLHKMEYAEAEKVISNAVGSILQELQVSGKARLDHIGDLILQEETVVLRPLDLEGFHYSPIESTLSQDSFDKELPGPIIPAYGNEVKNQQTVYRDTTVNKSVEDTKEGYNGKSSNRSQIFVLVAIFAIVLLGGLYYYSAHYRSPQQDLNISPIAVDTTALAQDTTLVAVTTDTAADSLDIGRTDSLKVDTAVAPIAAKKPKKEKRYTIVIGSHASLTKAEAEVEAYHKKGYKAVRIIMPNMSKNKKMVIWDAYETRAERDSVMAYVQKNINSDAWPHILSKKQ